MLQQKIIMKKIVSYIFLLSLLLPTLSFSKTIVTEDKKNIDVLFIQIADKGELTPIPNKPGYFYLKLRGIKEHIQFFTDRPNRTAGIYPTSDFLQKWQQGKGSKSFNKMPPNVALSAIEVRLLKNRRVDLILQLSAPIYNTKHHTVTYTARTLKGSNPDMPTRKFKDVALFIDNYCASCTGLGW